MAKKKKWIDTRFAAAYKRELGWINFSAKAHMALLISQQYGTLNAIRSARSDGIHKGTALAQQVVGMSGRLSNRVRLLEIQRDELNAKYGRVLPSRGRSNG